MSSIARGMRRARNPRGQGAQLREEILVAATSLLEELGDEHALTLRGIARRAGIAAPSIYNHFSDLDAIVTAVVLGAQDEYEQRLRDAVGAASTPLEKIVAGAHAYIDFGRTRPGSYRILMERRDPARQPAAAAVGRNQTARTRDLILDAAPHITRQEAEDRARMLWLYLHGAVALPLTQPRYPWPDDGTIITQITDVILR